MLDLSPADQADAHYWASVLLAHFTVGLALTAAAGLLTRSVWVAAAIVAAGYAIAWEVCWQALGAGVADAAVDTAAVASGALVAAAAWSRKGGAVALVLTGLALGMWRGIRRRA